MGKNYFDNKVVTSAVLEFQSTGNRLVLNPFVSQIRRLVKAEINTHKFYQYGDTEDMEQEGFISAWNSLENFNHAYGKTLFSYLSLSIKYGLIDHTRKISRRRKNFKNITKSIEDIAISPISSEINYKIIRNKLNISKNTPLGRTLYALESILETTKTDFDEDIIIFLMQKSKSSRLQVEKSLNNIGKIMKKNEDKKKKERKHEKH